MSYRIEYLDRVSGEFIAPTKTAPDLLAARSHARFGLVGWCDFKEGDYFATVKLDESDSQYIIILNSVGEEIDFYASIERVN